jgi:hypothetical protein
MISYSAVNMQQDTTKLVWVTEITPAEILKNDLLVTCQPMPHQSSSFFQFLNKHTTSTFVLSLNLPKFKR